MDFVGARSVGNAPAALSVGVEPRCAKERCRQDGQEQGRNHVTLVGVNDGRGCHAASLG